MKNILVFGLPMLVVFAITGLFLFGGARSAAKSDPVNVFGSVTQTDSYGTSTSEQQSAPALVPVQKPSPQSNKKFMNAILHTNKGDITIEFAPDQAPKTVENFVKLASSNFYDGVKFHRVIKGFMIQGGDPLTKDDSQMARWGTGGPGYMFEDEITPNNHDNAGTIAMANAGPNTNGSQFFINVANNNFLDTKHTVFGHITAGMDIVKAIENTPTGQNDRPVSPVVINSITLN